MTSYNVAPDSRTHSAAWRDINVNGAVTSGEAAAGDRLAAGAAGSLNSRIKRKGRGAGTWTPERNKARTNSTDSAESLR